MTGPVQTNKSIDLQAQMGSSPSSFKVPESKHKRLQSTGGIPCGLVVRTPGTQEAGCRFNSPMDPHWQIGLVVIQMCSIVKDCQKFNRLQGEMTR